AVVAGLCGASSTAQAAGCPWMNTSKPADQRAQQLLAAMSLDDKIAMTYGQISQYGFAAQTPANDALFIPQFVSSDGPAAIAGGFGGTQQGVTAFPVGISQASAWNRSLERRFGRAEGQEALGKGANVVLGPAMNIARVPMNGRNYEYF